MVPRNSLCVHKQSKAPWEQRGGAVVPNTLLDAHAFSTSIREFLQIPKATGKKRKETDSSPTDETPGKIMRTGTTEQWKKVVPKNGRRKASPKHKAGTIPFNPNPIGPIPINSDNLNRSTDPKSQGLREQLLQRAKISQTYRIHQLNHPLPRKLPQRQHLIQQSP